MLHKKSEISKIEERQDIHAKLLDKLFEQFSLTLRATPSQIDKGDFDVVYKEQDFELENPT